MPLTNFTQFINFLTKRLDSPLPGTEAHKKMMPGLKQNIIREFPVSGKASINSALVLLLENNGNVELLLTLRSRNLKSHGGQISFPGGRKEDNENDIQTALREAEEEIALNPDNVDIIGKLSELYVPPSNNIIIPVVGELKRQQEFIPNPNEVEEIFTVKLSELHARDLYDEQEWDYKGMGMTVPLWKVHKETPLWGATAMIISELVSIYNEFLTQETK